MYQLRPASHDSPLTIHKSRFTTHALAALVLLALAGAAALAQEPAGTLLDFTAAEVRAILQQGPWPVPWSRDTSNRVSGKAEAIALGERLFFEPRLSVNGEVSCATCHAPERNFTDGLKLAIGQREAVVERHTQSVLNVRLNRWFGWDGSGDSLWAQSVRPMLDARELAGSEQHIAQLVRSDRDLACGYERAFGVRPPANDEAVTVDAAKALAAFQETLVSGRTAFDEFRDALARGEREAAARYPQDAQRGLRIFVGKGTCNVCHFGPNFSNGEFEEIGIPHFLRAGGVDWGRAQGIKNMLASRFSLLRAYNDDRAREGAISARHVDLQLRNYGEFRIPSLRNVALTAPYMHNGHFATLAEVVRHYSEIDPNNLHLGPEIYDRDGVLVDLGLPSILKPLKLTEAEIADVVAFLQTLTDSDSRTPRKPLSAAPACR
jgi:cytochrome c peroxidase